ncbi:MAG: PAS domain S-box protein [Candidatus Cloacimonetes bacterium]|nr:PAS domain S-box protein [Candidatus Cloacimonadota bacterium]
MNKRVALLIRQSFYLLPVIISITAMLCWLTSQWELLSFGTNYVPLSPINAIFLLTLGLFSLKHESIIKGRTSRSLVRVLLVVTGMVSISVFISPQQHLGSWFENLLFPHEVMVGAYPVGRIAPSSGLFLFFLSLLFLLQLSNKVNKIIHQAVFVLSSMLVIASLWIIISYLLKFPVFYGSSNIPMSLVSAYAMFFLSAGVWIRYLKGSILARILGWELSLHPNIREYYYGRSILLFFVFSLIIGMGGIVYLKLQIELVRQKAIEQISTVADMRVLYVHKWYADQIKNVKYLFGHKELYHRTNLLIAGSIDSEMREDLEDFRQNIKAHFNYYEIALFDVNGRLHSTSSDSHLPTRNEVLKRMDELREKHDLVVSDLTLFHLADNIDSLAIHIDYWLPVFKTGTDSVLVGAWYLQKNPHVTFYPSIQSWPEHSKTAETLLVRKEGDSVVFLNELRHKKHTALNLHFPLAEKKNLPAVIAIEERAQITEGYDYRDVLVLSALRKIPDTPWYLVSKIDCGEVYKPIKNRALTLGSFLAFLLFVTAFGISYFERRRELFSSRKQAEEWKATFDSVNDVIWLLDKNCRILRSNNACKEMLGVTPEEILGKHCWEVVHDSEYPIKECPFQEMSMTKSRSRIELNVKSRWFAATLDPIVDNQGKIQGIVHIIRDITERKIAEGAIKEREERLQTIIDNAPFGAHTFELTPDNKLILIGTNRSADDILHIDNKLLLGKELLEAFPGNKDTGVPEAYREVLKTGKSFSSEQVNYSDGTIVGAFDVHAMQIAPNKVTAFFRDITEKKKADDEIKKLNESLEQRVAARTAELIIANRELEAFSHSVSHDLRAPLRGIDGISLIVLEEYGDKLDEKGKEYLQLIRDDTKNMGELIDALLSLAKTTRADMSMKRTNLSLIVERNKIEFDRQYPEREISYKIEPDLFAYGDSQLLEIVINNLIANAVKYTSKREKAIIEFGKTMKEGKEVFFVKDNGVGFDMKYYSKLFGTFQRLHSSKDFPGTGIGLATVKRVLERHGGSVWADSKENEFAAFYFTLKEE